MSTTKDKASGMEKRVKIESLVMGSLVGEQGDTTLSFTRGYSTDVEFLCRSLTGDGPRHATLYLLHPEEGRHLVAHVQGSHTTFGGGVRDYATRAVYEFDGATLTEAGGYLPLLPLFDGMRHYEEKTYETAAERMMGTVVDEPLTPTEQRLGAALAQALAHHCRLFIQVGEEELRVGDDLRHSSRLRSLLHVFDHLPPRWREEATLAFSVNHASADMQALLPDVQVLVHHDPIGVWDDEVSGAYLVDWTGAEPQWKSQERLPSWQEALQQLEEALADVDSSTADPTPATPSAESEMPQSPPSRRKGCFVNLLMTLLLIVLGLVCCPLL